MGAMRLREALRSGQLSVGTWIQVGHATSAEILADTGFDWVAVDCEHADIGIAEFADLARGVKGRQAGLLARVRENDTLAIRQILDMGADGVIVPLISTAEEAERAVRAAKYPPRGIRGYAFTRANDWGRSFDEYAGVANDDIAVIAMIETSAGVANIESILGVDGIDAVFIGPYDMSGSYGVPGQTSHPLVQQGCARVVDACHRAGKPAGLHVVIPTPEAIRHAVQNGFRLVALGMDTVFIREGAQRALAALKDI